jgi:hypothetical protein
MGASIEPYPIGLPRILNPRFLSLACVAIVGWFLFAVLDPELAAGQQLPNWAPPAIDVFPDHNEFVAGKRPVQELVVRMGTSAGENHALDGADDSVRPFSRSGLSGIYCCRHVGLSQGTGVAA